MTTYIQESVSIGDQCSFVKFVNSMHCDRGRDGVLIRVVGARSQRYNMAAKRYSSWQVPGGLHTLDDVVCVYTDLFRNHNLTNKIHNNPCNLVILYTI